MVKEVKRFGDLQPEIPEADEKVDIDALVDQDVEFLAYAVLPGSYGDFMVIVVKDIQSGRKLSFSTGAGIIMRKIKEAKAGNYLPLLGKIVKPGRYYDII